MVAMASATPMTTPHFSPQLLSNRAVVRLTGVGVLAFLNNLLTAELKGQSPAYAALLSPQGKILHDLFVVPDGDTVWLDVSRLQSGDLLKRLMMYRLRAKIEIIVDDSKAVAVSSSAELHGSFYADPRLSMFGYRAIVAAGTIASGAGYDTARFLLGLADSDTDIGSGDLFVQEANLDQLHGVHFNKGCYVGQEVVSRTHHRHTTRNRILPVSFDGEIEKGADILSGELRIGTMLSSEEGRGLALLRLDRLAEAKAPLLTSGVKLSVQKPDWANFDVTIPEATI
jgi:tRNA-modifying protein YgfZ